MALAAAEIGLRVAGPRWLRAHMAELAAGRAVMGETSAFDFIDMENGRFTGFRPRSTFALIDPELIMVQEFIPGSGETQFSYAAICKDGRVLASLVARRTRQYPIDFGLNSTFVETVDEPAIEQPSRRLLAELRYTGAVEVEYKCDRSSGRYKLLDVNPRLWAWHTLGERAGGRRLDVHGGGRYQRLVAGRHSPTTIESSATTHFGDAPRCPRP